MLSRGEISAPAAANIISTSPDASEAAASRLSCTAAAITVMVKSSATAAPTAVWPWRRYQRRACR